MVTIRKEVLCMGKLCMAMYLTPGKGGAIQAMMAMKKIDIAALEAAVQEG